MKNRQLFFSFVVLLTIAATCKTSSAQDSRTDADPVTKEVAGKRIFYQRCSVCHLTPIRARSTGTKAYGPLLKGFVHDSDSEQQAGDTIRNGKGTVMPGFQYGLRPEEIDEIVAYLKTYK